MKREKIETLNEKDFVISLIMSDKCCKVLIPYISLDYFDIEYMRIVVEWIIGYYKKFKCCPRNDMQSLYLSHHDEIADDSTRNLIAVFLQNLADSEVSINNEEYLLDRGKDFLDSKALRSYADNLNACLEVNDLEKARKLQGGCRKVSETETNELSLLSKDCAKMIEESLEKKDEELLKLPRNLGKVIGKLRRNDFLAILAPPKRGKSWFLQYIGLEAMKQGLNVIFVSMEMSREEVVQRMWKALYGSKSGLIEEGIYEAARIVKDPSDDGKYYSELFDVRVKDSRGKSVGYLQRQSRAGNQNKGDLRVIAYPSFGASATDITQRCEELANEGFVADVVIIDYADITKPMGGGTEVRNQLDATWKHLRFFAMKFHCLMVTASQTNRSALSSSEIGGSSIAEDFRKLAHITSMVSMEQTPKMRDFHIMRIRNVAVRNDNVEETCVFPQCLSLGQFVFGEPVLGKDFNFVTDDER